MMVRHSMVRLTRVVLAVLAMGAFGAVGGAARADATGPTETERLVRTHATERYNVAVPGYSIRAGGGMTAINAPLSTVRRIVTDYGHYSDFMPRFQKSRIVGKSGPNTDVYLQVSILHGAANIWAVTRFGAPVPEGSGERIEGRLHGQGNVDQLLAIWHLIPVDDHRTIAKIELLIVPKLPLPGSVVTPELEYASDQAVTATRERAEARTRSAAGEHRQDTAAN
jgi:ribosome-associated toxin RatA of RatAB toxin-antitoxin module